MQSRFAKTTKKLMKNLPSWFRMRKDPNAIGAQFLNITGLQFDDIQFYLQYAFDNYFIDTVDINAADVIYKATLPSSLTPEDRIFCYAEGIKMEESKSLKEFLRGFSANHLPHKEIFYDRPCYIDWVRKLIYVKQAYDVSTDYPEGMIELTLRNAEGNVTLRTPLPTSIHHVWNFFDEFGLLLDTPRLYGEKNAEYKERLLDVFRNPANSTRRGLQNHLARELGLTNKLVWHDGSIDLILKSSNIITDTILVGGTLWDMKNTYIDASDRLVLKGDPKMEGISREVKYVAGIEMHTFFDKRDTAFQKELYSIDRIATPMLQYYVDVITNEVPVMWDQFVWNESFWDIAQKDMSGYGYIPSYYDARFLNWKKYKG